MSVCTSELAPPQTSQPATAATVEYALPSYAQVQAARCAQSLHAYVKRAWHVVEPGTQFVDGWHIKAICDHLEAAYRREIQNLIINVPPRHMKSLCVSVFFPTWVWGPKESPAERFLCASYAQELATRDNLKCRRIIRSRWYQRRWGNVFKLTGDQNQKTRFENDKTGYRIAVGVDGSSTGEGGSIRIIDDAHKADDSHSDVKLEKTWRWHQETWSTRGNDPKTALNIIIMQRLSDNDLVGHLLSEMQEENARPWEVLCLPAEYEPVVRVTTVGWKDPRTKPGELIWPEQYDRKNMEYQKASMGPMAVAGQLQQRPAPEGGAIYLTEYWDGQNRFDADDRGIRNQVVARWISLDTGFKEGESNAYTAAVVVELSRDYRALARHVERHRLDFPKLSAFTAALMQAWSADGKLQGVIIEDQASGISLIQTLQQNMAKHMANLIIPFRPSGTKPERAIAASVWCANGSVLLPTPSPTVPWLFPFEQELYKFPTGAYKDQADAFAQAVDYIVRYLEQGLRVRMGMAA